MARARLLVVALLGALACVVALTAAAQSPTLTVSGRDLTRTYTVSYTHLTLPTIYSV